VTDTPTLVLGRIRTMDPAQPVVRAMLVAGDRVAAVGDPAALPAGTSRVPAAGVVVPGFVDARVHTLIAGIERRRLTISAAGSVAEVCDRIGAWLAARPDADWVVVGAHVHAEDLADGRLPDRHDLDRVTGGRAVVLDRRTHDAIANSDALRRCCLDAATPRPGRRPDRARPGWRADRAARRAAGRGPGDGAGAGGLPRGAPRRAAGRAGAPALPRCHRGR
jgi:predicted amidohydrolase YtcJ